MIFKASLSFLIFFSVFDLSVSERYVLKLPDDDYPCSQYLMVILSNFTLYSFEMTLLGNVGSGLMYLPSVIYH